MNQTRHPSFSTSFLFFSCYSVEVTLRGPVDPHTGMVLNLAILKDAIKECIAEPLDHRNLDMDVEYFRDSGIPSTTENLAIFVYDSIKQWMDSRGRISKVNDNTVNGHSNQEYDGSLLYEIKIYETDKNVIIYRGE